MSFHALQSAEAPAILGQKTTDLCRRPTGPGWKALKRLMKCTKQKLAVRLCTLSLCWAAFFLHQIQQPDRHQWFSWSQCWNTSEWSCDWQFWKANPMSVSQINVSCDIITHSVSVLLEKQSPKPRWSLHECFSMLTVSEPRRKLRWKDERLSRMWTRFQEFLAQTQCACKGLQQHPKRIQLSVAWSVIHDSLIWFSGRKTSRKSWARAARAWRHKCRSSSWQANPCHILSCFGSWRFRRVKLFAWGWSTFAPLIFVRVDLSKMFEHVYIQ